MGVNRTEQTLSSRKATNSRVAPLRGAALGGWLLLHRRTANGFWEHAQCYAAVSVLNIGAFKHLIHHTQY